MSGLREQAKARTRAAIVEAGITLMHEHGYAATTTMAIAQAAGVSQATLFNYFPTKAMIVFADEHLWVPVARSMTTGASPHETLRTLMLQMLDNPGWTRPVDDPLTRMRFDLVRREPDLAAAQISLAFAQVPALATSLSDAHPDLTDDQVLALAGSAVGGVLAALTWTTATDVRSTVENAISQVAGISGGQRVR